MQLAADAMQVKRHTLGNENNMHYQVSVAASPWALSLIMFLSRRVASREVKANFLLPFFRENGSLTEAISLMQEVLAANPVHLDAEEELSQLFLLQENENERRSNKNKTRNSQLIQTGNILHNLSLF